MAAVQFPNPAATNPETNAPYSDGWTADNGVTYIYEDNAWKAQSVPGESADSRYVEVAGDNMTGNLTLGTDKITLNATDGSADFAGNTVVGSWDAYDPVDSNQGLTLDKIGTIYANRIASGGAIWQGNLNGANTSSILADGSATFAGPVEVGNFGTSTASTIGTLISETGALFARGSGTDGQRLIGAWRDTDEVFKVTLDGSADFANGVTAKAFVTGVNGGVYFSNPPNNVYLMSNTPVSAPGAPIYIGNSRINTTTFYEIWTEPDNPANFTTTTEEYEEQEEVTPYVPAVPATYDEDGNELTAEVPAVEATYQTVTKTRDISTYTGPTLDVKERLTKADTALQTLKTAAAAAVDFASLQAAIATALADI